MQKNIKPFSYILYDKPYMLLPTFCKHVDRPSRNFNYITNYLRMRSPTSSSIRNLPPPRASFRDEAINDHRRHVRAMRYDIRIHFLHAVLHQNFCMAASFIKVKNENYSVALSPFFYEGVCDHLPWNPLASILRNLQG